jgi:hypothetical protein
MEVSRQVYVRSLFLREMAADTPWMQWMAHTASLDAMEKRKFFALAGNRTHIPLYSSLHWSQHNDWSIPPSIWLSYITCAVGKALLSKLIREKKIKMNSIQRFYSLYLYGINFIILKGSLNDPDKNVIREEVHFNRVLFLLKSCSYLDTEFFNFDI